MKIKFIPTAFSRSYFPYLVAAYILAYMIRNFDLTALWWAIPGAFVFHRIHPLKP